MSPVQQWWLQFFFQLSGVLPYFAAGTAAVVVVSLTPFGRALTRFLRESRPTDAMPPEIEESLTALRADTAEVLERLGLCGRAASR